MKKGGRKKEIEHRAKRKKIPAKSKILLPFIKVKGPAKSPAPYLLTH
jgi:hypothetical protein